MTHGEIDPSCAVAHGVESGPAENAGPSADAIAAADPQWGAGLLGDKAHSMVFDNSKLRTVVPDFCATIPFERGAREIVAWYDEDPARQQPDGRLDALMDKLAAAYRP